MILKLNSENKVLKEIRKVDRELSRLTAPSAIRESERVNYLSGYRTALARILKDMWNNKTV